MAKSKSASQEEFPAMETPKDAKLENASRKYKRTIGERLLVQQDEANQKAKVGELVHAWAAANNIKPVIVKNDKGVSEECYVYRRGDIEAVVSRSLKENIKVRMGDELPAAEGDANVVTDAEEGGE